MKKLGIKNANQILVSLSSSLLAIVCGLLVGLIVLLISSPANALNGFTTILFGGFSSLKNIGQVFYTATPIILTGLSVGFANKTGLFNIGAAGQFIVGAFVAVFLGVNLTFIPAPFLWIICLIGAMLGGALWGVIPGMLNAYRNVNVVIACIMMNYVGTYLVNMLIKELVFDPLRNQSQPVAAAANAPKLGMDKIFVSGASASSINVGIFIAIIAGITIYIILNKTKFGYELKACGLNRDAAKYAGINEKRSIVTSMAIAGALAGLAGACVYLSGAGLGIEVVDVLASEGFTGIPVALLGMNHPIGIIFSGLFIGYLTQGGFNMQIYGFAPQVIEIITSVIIYFSAFALIFKEFVYKKIIAKTQTKTVNANSDTNNSLQPNTNDNKGEK